MLAWKVFKTRVGWISFAPDSTSLLVCGDAEGMKLLDGFTGAERWSVANKRTEQSVFWHGVFTPDGKKTVGLEGGQLIVRRADSGAVLGRVAHSIGVFTVVDNKRLVAVGHGMDTTSMRLFDLKGKAIWKKILLYMGGIRQLRLSPNGRHLAAVNELETLFFDMATQKLRGKFPTGTWGSSFGGLDFSPDSRWLVFATPRELHVVNAESAECTKSVSHEGKALQEIVLTPDGERLFTVDKGPAVTVWDTTTWKAVKQYDWEIGGLTSVAVAPDGCRAAVGSSTGKVLLWDLDDRR